MVFVQVLTGLDFNSPSWDLFIFLFFIVATFVYGFTLGRSRIMVLLVSTYMALALARTAPFLTSQDLTVGGNPFFVVQITAFLAVLLLIFFLLSNSALRKGLASEDVHGKVWQIIVFGILQAGFLVAAVLSFLPAAQRDGLLGLTHGLFATDTALFIWALLPIVFMTFIKDPEDD